MFVKFASLFLKNRQISVMVHSNRKSDESLSTKKAVRILLSMKETESIFVFTSVKKGFL